jgi:hypothetical protein
MTKGGKPIISHGQLVFCSGCPTKSYYSKRAVPSCVQTLHYPEHMGNMKEYDKSSLPYKLAFHFNIRPIIYITLHRTASQFLGYFQTRYETIDI